MQDEMLDALKVVMNKKGVGQAELAKKLGVSQSTICRALARRYKRKSRARSLLEEYIEINESKVNKMHLPEYLTQALSLIWDGTEVHALALTRIIRSLDGLVPK